MATRFHFRSVIVGATFLAAIPLPAAGDHICVYDATTKTVTIGDGTHDRLLVAVGKAGVIKTSKTSCGGATRFNTDTIEIAANAPAAQSVWIRGVAQDFAPGFTDEPGDSDEIEFQLDLSAEDTVRFDAGRNPDVRVGSAVSTAFTRLNLNADEAEGVDADVFVDAAASEVFLGAGRRGRPARFDASGGARTGRHFAGRTSLDGSNESDLLIGGLRRNRFVGLNGNDRVLGNRSRDRVRAGFGLDVVFGAGGDDRLVGEIGRDEIHGGRGDDVVLGRHDDDRLFGGEGIDVLGGGDGTDRCTGGAGNDEFRSCEEHD